MGYISKLIWLLGFWKGTCQTPNGKEIVISHLCAMVWNISERGFLSLCYYVFARFFLIKIWNFLTSYQIFKVRNKNCAQFLESRFLWKLCNQYLDFRLSTQTDWDCFFLCVWLVTCQVTIFDRTFWEYVEKNQSLSIWITFNRYLEK